MIVLWCAAGGQNDQNLANAGPEANLDTQFAFGLTFPTPRTFYSTGGSPPFTRDALTPTNTNEPYDDVRDASPFLCLPAEMPTLAQWCLTSGCNLYWVCPTVPYRRPSPPATAMMSRQVTKISSLRV
jgi:hypothetical protein